MCSVVKLVSQSGTTSIHIDARIDESGDLLLSGQDFGEAPPPTFFGNDDYECRFTMSAAEKDRILQRFFSSDFVWRFRPGID